MAILLQQKNFSPNVIYFVVGHYRQLKLAPNIVLGISFGKFG